MSRGKRRLPKPPASPFGRKLHSEDEEEPGALIADQMAGAMAEGRLEEFLKKELPDNEYARKLSMMMLGMTGMLPQGHGLPAPTEKSPDSSVGEESVREDAPVRLPEDVATAVQAGDVQSLMELLKREFEKRSSHIEGDASPDEKKVDSPAASGAIEKETMGTLMEIASENNLSLDWIVLRALRRYIRDYRKTGAL